MDLISILLIGISLSMDAFSLSLAYSSRGIRNNDIIKISFCVGLFHFFMPLLGSVLGGIILDIIKIQPELLTLIILSIIGLEMIESSFKKNNKTEIYALEIFAFALAVSIDSFSVGIALTSAMSNILKCGFIFSITSLSFTFFGLKIGKIVSKLIGNFANLLGGIILIILGISYIL